MFPRRRVLQLIGGGTVIAAGAAGGFATTRRPEAALLPWDEAGMVDEPRRFALSYAILAPNPHNRQPWQVALEGEDRVIVWRDTDRALPATDPFDRQLTIGMGCFLELMAIAAAESGYTLQTELYPDGEDGPVAVCTFADGASADPLFAHILERRSCKEPFEDRTLPDDTSDQLSPLADIITTADLVADLRALTWRAWQIEAQTPHTHKESVDLMRFGKSEIEANPDGIDLGGPMLESLMLLGLMNREAMLDPASTASKEGWRMYETMLAATPAYAVISTPTNTRTDQIEAGRRWLRLNLTTTALGLALHPVSQCLQEYPEMAEPYAEAHEMLASDGGTVQMLGRLGFGPNVPQTPRWPLETRIIDG